MARRSAALLTKTQRRRIRNDFDDQSEAQRQRDRKRIRDRIESGMDDFQLLATYPDRELTRVLSDCSTAETTAILADAQLTIERLRVLQEIDRTALLETAQQRAATQPERHCWSAGATDLRTNAEIQSETREQLTPSRRLRWATRIMGVAGIAYCISVLLFSIDSVFNTNFYIDGPNVVVASLFACMYIGLTGWTAIIGLTTIQVRLFPIIRAWISTPGSHHQE